MKLILALLTSLFLFTGCDYNVKQESVLDTNGVTQIAPNLYIKAIKVKAGDGIWHIIYIYCDSQGIPLGVGPITNNYTIGKSHQTITTFH